MPGAFPDDGREGPASERNKRHVARISEWLRLESPTTSAAGVNAVMDKVATEAASAPVSAERIPGRDGLGDLLVLRAGPPSGKPGVLLMSHLDTVHPTGTLERDLPIRVEGDRLYGPGVYDMKGGAYLALEAFLDVARRGSARLPITFLFTPDEEIGSPLSRPVIEDLCRGSAYALVTESARKDGKVVTARKGVGRFDVHVEGRPGHSGASSSGVSAIREAARLILQIEAMSDRDKGVRATVNMIAGGTAPNVVPQHCRFSIDLRVMTAEAGEFYASRIHALRPRSAEARVTVTGGVNRPPYRKTEAIGRLHLHAQAVAAELGFPLDDVPMAGGGSDANFAAALGLPTLDGLGIGGNGAHTLQEYGLIPTIEPRIRLLTRLLETLS